VEALPKLLSFVRKFLLAVIAVFAVVATLGYLFPHQLLTFALELDRSHSGLHRAETDIPGFHIIYLDGGRGEPLILLHGIGADKDNWTRIARWLTPHYRVIAPDLPGFGESSKPDNAAYTVEDQVRNVAAFAQALHLTRFSIGGNSMGGWIAGAYVAAHPDQIISAWLLAPGGITGAKDSELAKIVRQGGHVPVFARNADEMRELLNFVFVHPPYVPGFLIDELARQQARNYAMNMKILGQLTGEWPSASLNAALAGSTTPALITWGDSDRALDVSGAEVLHGLMPNSQVTIMAGIGHVPVMEVAETSANDYLQFRSRMTAGPQRAHATQ
jgi:pimeloyl-ACP methyl ester carboxylesterase